MTKNKYYFQRIILFLCAFFAVAAHAANQLEGVRIWAAPESTRIVFDLSEVPNYSYFSLDGPHRLVVDLKKASTKLSLKNIDNNSKLVKGIRVSKSPTKGDLRLVIDLVKPLNANLFSLPVTAPYGNRLVVDLEDKTVTASPSVTSSTSVKKSVNQSVPSSRDIVIAIDAGHAGALAYADRA